MVIRKQYDIGQLAETLQQAIELSKKYNCVVKIDILTAHEILEVLQETHKRERRNQTLESALTFIETEDGTHTNLMEEANRKPECFGMCMLGSNDTWNICEECSHIEQCKVATEHE